MLYARCGYCGQIAPLWCAGQFMPHPPQPTMASAQGAYCPVCGILPPVFTCNMCWCRQYLVVQGAQVPMQRMAGQTFAAAVQAPQGTSHGKLMELFMAGAKSFLEGAGNQAGQWAMGQWT